MTEKDVIQRFRKLHMSDDANDQFRMNANSLLDQLISLAHVSCAADKPQRGEGSQHMTEEDFLSFITYGCRILKEKHLLLKSKFADAMYLILIKQQRTLSPEVLPIVLPFILSSLMESPASLKINFLQALGAVVYQNGSYIDLELLEELLNPSHFIWSLLKPSNGDFISQIECIQCLGNLCAKSSSGSYIDKSFFKVCYQNIMDYLRALLNIEDMENLELHKLIAKTLKVLQQAVTTIVPQDGIVEPEFAIALLRVYLVYGLPASQSIIAHLVKNLPSARTAPAFDSGVLTKKTKCPVAKQVLKKKRKGKRSSSRRHVNSQEDEESVENTVSDLQSTAMKDDNILNFTQEGYTVSSQSSSESDFSDPETGFRSSVRRTCCRIRQNAAKCIQDILKVSDRRAKLSSWLLLVPEALSHLEPSLMSSFINDPTAKVRLSALSTLIELINDSKQYLEAAVDRTQSLQTIARSFVPFSVKLNQSLVLLHEAFLEHLNGRKSDFAKEKALQCLSILVLNTPYEKIGAENLHKIIALIPRFLYVSDLNVTISTLTCFAASLSVKPDDAAIKTLMLNTPKTIQKMLPEIGSRDVTFRSWLVKYCYIELERDDRDGSTTDSTNQERIKNQCLQLLKIVVQFYPCLVSNSERKVLLFLICKRYVKMMECTLSVHAIKLLEEFGKSLSKLRADVNSNLEEQILFWKEVFDGPLIGLFQSATPVSKILSAACDVLSTISDDVFLELHMRYQIMVKTLLLGAADDNDNQIKSAAIRALGILVTYSFVKEDHSFVVDVGEVIFRQLKSPSLNVRIKAGWSFGNLTNSLITNWSSTESNLEFSSLFILELLEACKKSASDHDKIKPNGVRAIGNVLKWLPAKVFEQPNVKKLVEEVIATLIQNIVSGPMKGRWNACYACSNMFQGSSLPFDQVPWMEEILKALGSAMKDCKNFKVRISAAIALSTPDMRSIYGDEQHFVNIWVYSIDALISSENLSDFTEFKFKKNLQNKICRLICHLLSLASSSDLDKMQPTIDDNVSLLNEHLWSFFDGISKEEENEEKEEESCISKEGIDVKALIQNLSKLQKISPTFGNLEKILAKISAI
ncbi:HEAT repeat-containing protein 6-like [Rhopilema esculentum]|uniref:HEAT repeat-containing protein 6-like n=1 Tax=Rhopilema esculentum TaxID=499914 RepID=UPI0031DDA654